MTIKATGKRNGIQITIQYVGGSFLFNGKINEEYENDIKEELSHRHFAGGTYQPKEKDDMNLINVIENYFFDRCAEEIEVHGAVIDEEMESIPGRIY